MSSYLDWYAVRKDLKRRKIGDRQYEISRRSTGEIVATVTQVGEHSRDDYPWDTLSDLPGPNLGASESLDSALGAIAGRILSLSNTDH